MNGAPVEAAWAGGPRAPPNPPSKKHPHRRPQNTACTSPIHTRSSPGATLEAPAGPYELALPKTRLPPDGWPGDQTPDPRWAPKAPTGPPGVRAGLGRACSPLAASPQPRQLLPDFIIAHYYKNQLKQRKKGERRGGDEPERALGLAWRRGAQGWPRGLGLRLPPSDSEALGSGSAQDVFRGAGSPTNAGLHLGTDG